MIRVSMSIQKSKIEKKGAHKSGIGIRFFFITLILFLWLPDRVSANQPQPWQMDFQKAATSIMHEIVWFERYTLWFIIPITIFVFLLLLYCIIRFSEKNNPIPSRTSHNTWLEVIWTIAPVMILMFFAVPSFQLLTAQYTPPEDAALTVKATGNQWNWDYEYQIDEAFSFNSSILREEDRIAIKKENRSLYPRLLAVDNEMVVPVNTMTRVLVTASDVIHAFAVPAFGIKVDAVPGRMNETWFKASTEGIYYGQCSELCGKDHAFMPIAIRVVSDKQYKKWLEAAKTSLSRANAELSADIEAGTKRNTPKKIEMHGLEQKTRWNLR